MTKLKAAYVVRLNHQGKGSIEYLGVCEICEMNPKENPEGKWCESCRDDFKASDNE